MIAILSDIHSNLEALKAVLKDVAAHSVEEIYCLGDIVGYGPNPRECLDLVMGWPVVLLGNHDQAVMFDPSDFNPIAERATMWTRKQLEAPIRNRDESERRWEFLAELPLCHRDGSFLFVHGSPSNPLNEYIFPEDIYTPRKLERIFGQVERYCLHGHTHIPGIFTEDFQFYSPEEIDFSYHLDGPKILCNVGSVGQPRDGDWRACYVLLDDKDLRFRRVEYDVDTTIKKIYAAPDLDRFLGDRLRQGR
jgi:diadenosine tetraphosphatase ApaH/serine/threonine PP2A family protein phosphatase